MWEQAWLDYGCHTDRTKDRIASIGRNIYIDKEFHDDICTGSAIREYELFSGKTMIVHERAPLLSDRVGIYLAKNNDLTLDAEGYIVKGYDMIEIKANSGAGILYGMYQLIETIRLKELSDPIHIKSEPRNGFRMINHWDNMDGTIERGYSGDSFFFVNNQLVVNDRTITYVRLMASIGINSVAINNVNVKDEATYLITERHLKPMIQLAKLFEAYNIKLFLSINYAAPMDIGELTTADPLDETFIKWWGKKSAWLFETIPNFGGYLVKADSEGRPGPFTYGRTQADGANMLARTVEPFGGTVIWRCFVYNCQQDWRDTKMDRAKAGYEAFMPLDGTFLDNVILQIKNGPMDFQVREPVSPLFGAMHSTNQVLEVQAAQEYTGQQRHVCYLVPMWKEILNFDTCYGDGLGQVKDIVSGKTYGRSHGGMVAVINTGNDDNWTGHDLAAANWYGFGKLAWNPDSAADAIANDFVRLTFGHSEVVVKTITEILMTSWSTYEDYTSPLGIGWMVNPEHHYGPNVDGYEYDRWGTYHRATLKTIGVDRTVNGTNYTGQYHKTLQDIYNNIETCPMSLLLFFHQVAYTYVLPNGETLIQYIYDTHFDGADKAQKYYYDWIALKSDMDQKVYNRVKQRFEHQKEHARLWCDVINSYFYRKTGIEDKLGRSLY